jgi:hypothetical protein
MVAIMGNIKPIEIKKFLGVNTSVGETEIQLGEAVYMRNFRITKNYKPQKRDGHNSFISYGNTKNVYGAWTGVLNGKNVMLTVNDGKLYEYNFTTEVNTYIGVIADVPCSMIYFNEVIYLLNGTDFKQYNGVTYQDVVPYVPTIVIETPPSGGGTLFEEVNLLGSGRKQQFIGDGVAVVYQLAETNIDATLLVITINGVTKTETIDFTVNRSTGVIAFTVAPPNDSIVDATYHKTSATNKALITNNRFMTKFGVSNDTNVFIWGNINERNVFRVSAVQKPNYFPANSFYAEGDDEFAITDIIPQYDRIIIFKENTTRYSYAQENPLYGANTGLNPYIYTSYPLNDAVGNQAFGQVQLVRNNPISLSGKSVWEWSNTSVKDERNANIVSDRIKELLLNEDFSMARTYDYQFLKELWINIGSLVYVWNYGNDTWYVYDNIEATFFVEYDDRIYFGSKGTVEIVGEFTKNGVTNQGFNDNNDAVYAILELGFTDFGENNLTKNTRRLWITLEPQNRTSIVVNFETDEDFLDESNEQEIIYAFLDFNDVDFNFFPFTTNLNPQGSRLKVRAKKYQYIKFIFENNKKEQGLTLLSFLVQAETANYVK